MRIFIGTAVTPVLAGAVHERVAHELERTVWSPAPQTQWHVTALFIGERQDDLIPFLESALDKVADHTAPFTLKHGRLTTMPKVDPSMLWVRFHPHEALTRLHLALSTATAASPSVHRPYWPHITLARSRTGAPEQVQGPEVVERMTVDHITLFRSIPSAQGSMHTPLRTWLLKGTDPTAPSEAA